MQAHLSYRKRAATIPALAAMAALTVIALTACGSGGQDGGAGTRSVASLPTPAGQRPSSTGSASSGPAGLEGVTIPDNASPAVRNRIQDAWASCMEAHGDHHFVDKPGGPGGFLTTTDTMNQMVSEFPAAVQACRSLQPHSPWQELPQYNPNYQRDFAQWVNCLNAKGLPVKAVPGGWTYNGTSSLSQAQQEKVTVDCEIQAFHEN
jgi:hypothetical protein